MSLGWTICDNTTNLSSTIYDAHSMHQSFIGMGVIHGHKSRDTERQIVLVKLWVEI